MTFFQAIKSCIRQYVGFKGRASRSELWFFILFQMLVVLAIEVVGIAFLLMIVMRAVGTSEGSDQLETSLIQSLIPFIWYIVAWVVVCLLATLFFFLPVLSVIVRRLHDLNLSGWWLLFFYVVSTGIGVIWEVSLYSEWGVLALLSGLLLLTAYMVGIVYLCRKGTVGENRFGADPLLS